MRALGAEARRRAGPRWLLLALILLALAPIAAQAETGERIITGFEQSADGDGYHAIFRFQGTPDARIVRLANPDRIALDFSDTLPAVQMDKPPANDLVESLRHGLVDKDRYRVIFRLKQNGAPTLEHQTTANGETLTLLIRPDPHGQPAPGAPHPLARPGDSAAGDPAAHADRRTRPLKIVVDPGHGGIDEGAISSSGTKEKDINLALGLAIRDALSAYPCVSVVLTRDDDTFIPLEERSEIARKAHADLFISVHADSIRYHDLRGATVYTLSETASDELAREIAAGENAADRFAGPGWKKDEPSVFNILVDLTRRETVSFSEHFAELLVNDLKRNDVNLIKRPKRSAGFIVLKAPDVPSVLIEAGFLSNKDDVKLLSDPNWRKETADAIAKAVVSFFRGPEKQSDATH